MDEKKKKTKKKNDFNRMKKGVLSRGYRNGFWGFFSSGWDPASCSPLRAPCTASTCIPLASFCYTFKFIAEFYGKPQEAREQERCWVVNLERTVLKLQWRESHVDAVVGLLNIYFEGPIRRDIGNSIEALD
ncbi:hypothetical protein VNO77_38879 [Canavalia gladiata]|uniref:Uncharacterized protein n=1 Tax=Canavalia gladiata TaxID=3824 RepID=A0AAN9PWM4_CANGL